MKEAMLLVLLAVLSMVMISCGADGKSANDALIIMIDEESGENCAAGGTRVDTGLDLNGNNELDEDEITATHYVCDGDDGIDGDSGVDGSDGSDGEKGDPGLNGSDGSDGENGDPGTNGVCVGNTAPVINSITVNGIEYAGEPIQTPLSAEFTVTVNATDVDADVLTYSISGGFVNIVDNGAGDYTFTGNTEDVFHFTAIVSDGCQMVMKNFSIFIDSIVYSGANRNIVYNKDTSQDTISLFNSLDTWDDINLTLQVHEDSSQNRYSFGNMLKEDGNYVEFAFGSYIFNMTNFSLEEEIGFSQTYNEDTYKKFSYYQKDIDPENIFEHGDFRNDTGYVGLKFTKGTDIHYGWIQVSVTNYDNSNLEGILIDWAYNSKPDMSILTGQTNSL